MKPDDYDDELGEALEEDLNRLKLRDEDERRQALLDVLATSPISPWSPPNPRSVCARCGKPTPASLSLNGRFFHIPCWHRRLAALGLPHTPQPPLPDAIVPDPNFNPASYRAAARANAEAKAKAALEKMSKVK